jgi:hypothetical protein
MQQMSAGPAMARVEALRLEAVPAIAARHEGSGAWGWEQHRTSDPVTGNNWKVGIYAGRSLGDSCFYAGRGVVA